MDALVTHVSLLPYPLRYLLRLLVEMHDPAEQPTGLKDAGGGGSTSNRGGIGGNSSGAWTGGVGRKIKWWGEVGDAGATEDEPEQDAV